MFVSSGTFGRANKWDGTNAVAARCCCVYDRANTTIIHTHTTDRAITTAAISRQGYTDHIPSSTFSSSSSSPPPPPQLRAHSKRSAAAIDAGTNDAPPADDPIQVPLTRSDCGQSNPRGRSVSRGADAAVFSNRHDQLSADRRRALVVVGRGGGSGKRDDGRLEAGESFALCTGWGTGANKMRSRTRTLVCQLRSAAHKGGSLPSARSRPEGLNAIRCAGKTQH